MTDTLDFEVRFAADDAGIFSGYAARFGEQNSHNEILLPGAFRNTLAEHAQRGTKPPMLWSHDQSQPIGVWESVAEDATGLAVRGRLVTETAKGSLVTLPSASNARVTSVRSTSGLSGFIAAMSATTQSLKGSK